MFRIIPWRVEVCRREPRGTVAGATLLLAAVGAVALLVAGLQVATAQESGSTTATVDVAQRSILVSPGTVQYSDCGGTIGNNALVLPNGECRAPGSGTTTPEITITNGDAPATIKVSGSAFTTPGGTTPWSLCAPGGVFGPECTGSTTGTPGADEARVSTVSTDPNPTPPIPVYTAGPLGPLCDNSFGNGSCSASPNQSATEFLRLVGPASSTDSGPTFSHEVTWGAYP